ncbi:MAG: stage V sporulation protein AC [Oscillospiraceae bacterium]|nr:stage V sporulation protein AC [Oscillospiraceae bacterium]
MKMTNEEYAAYIKQKMPRSPLWKDMALAFVIGGAICCVGQGLNDTFSALGASEEDAGTWTSIALVFLGALLTGLGVYDRLAVFGGAGTLVPITGFANAVVSPALEFKTEGFIAGMAAKIFTIAGPVIVFGISASVIYGAILMLFG